MIQRAKGPPCVRCGRHPEQTLTVLVRRDDGSEAWCGACWTAAVLTTGWERTELLQLDSVWVRVAHRHWRPYVVRYYRRLQALVATHHHRVERTVVVESWMRPGFAVVRLLAELAGDREAEDSPAVDRHPAVRSGTMTSV